MKNLLSKLIRKKAAPRKGNASSILYLHHGNVEIGRLWQDEAGKYHFRYDENFPSTGLSKLPDFPEVLKEYVSPVLFPYFEVRIPSLKRANVIKQVKELNLDQNSEFELLNALGKRSSSDPYTLEATPKKSRNK